MRELVKLERGLFDRWIIVPVLCPVPGKWAWSGSRWVPLDGPVQICNFDTEAQAAGYATGAGFEVTK
jgi:hypothetical protein